jgi:hypothetical protein
LKITGLNRRFILELYSAFFFFILFLSPAPLPAADAAPSDAAVQKKDNPEPVSIQGYFSGKFISRSRVADENIRDDDIFDLRVDICRA